jgi:hypothetical protein
LTGFVVPASTSSTAGQLVGMNVNRPENEQSQDQQRDHYSELDGPQRLTGGANGIRRIIAVHDRDVQFAPLTDMRAAFTLVTVFAVLDTVVVVLLMSVRSL